MSAAPDDYVVDFQHIALLVSDVEVSKRWYADLLGWVEQFSSPMPVDLGDLNGFTGCSGDIAMGQIHGTRVEFVQMHTDEPLGRWVRNDHLGLFLLSVRVNDLDTVRSRCAELLVPIVREGGIGAGGSTTLFVQDPDGQEIAFVGPSA